MFSLPKYSFLLAAALSSCLLSCGGSDPSGQNVVISMSFDNNQISRADSSATLIFKSDASDNTGYTLLLSNNRLGNQPKTVLQQDLTPLSGELKYEWNTDKLQEGLYTVELFSDLNRQKTAEAPVSVVHSSTEHKGYYGDIQNILQDNCQNCHQPGGGGKPEFYDYQTTKALGRWLGYVIRNNGRSPHIGYMPPFFAADNGDKYSGYRGLTEREIWKISSWIEDDMPQGNPKDGREFIPESDFNPKGTLQQFSMSPFRPVEYQERGEDLYQCFVFDPGLTSTTYVTATDVIPGNPSLVHHAIIYGIAPELAETIRQEEDRNPQDPGYRCFGGPFPGLAEAESLGGASIIAGWAPGQSAQDRSKTPIALEPGTILAVQMHYYTKNDPDGIDKSDFNLWMTEESSEKQLITLPLADLDMEIPPGAKAHVEGITIPLRFGYVFYTANGVFEQTPDKIKVHSVYPHAHLLGKEISVDVIREDGTVEPLVRVPRWDFNWQGPYVLKNPVELGPKDTIDLRCTYDNSSTNPYQPFNPPQVATWGEGTTDEMCLAFLDVTVESYQETKGLIKSVSNDTTSPLASKIKRMVNKVIPANQDNAMPLKQLTEHTTCHPAKGKDIYK